MGKIGIGSRGLNGRPRAGGWAAAAAAAVTAVSLLVAGCSSATATYTKQPEPITQALVTAGGRYIVVPFTAGGCVQGGSVLTATETASTVTLVLSQVLSNGVCPADVSFGTAAVTLRQPVYGRSLVDGTTGRAIPYFDGRKLVHVNYIPPGYRFSGYGSFPGFAARFNAWETEYTSSGQVTAPVDVAQVPGSSTTFPSWPTTSPTKVNGNAATMEVLSSNGQVYGLAISWRAGGYTLVVYSAVVETGQLLVSAAELMKVAAGLRLRLSP
jgi:hypothetical protein